MATKVTRIFLICFSATSLAWLILWAMQPKADLHIEQWLQANNIRPEALVDAADIFPNHVEYVCNFGPYASQWHIDNGGLFRDDPDAALIGAEPFVPVGEYEARLLYLDDQRRVVLVDTLPSDWGEGTQWTNETPESPSVSLLSECGNVESVALWIREMDGNLTISLLRKEEG